MTVPAPEGSEPQAGWEVEQQPSVKFVGICHLCARRWGPLTCQAYPGGIPWEILAGTVDHRKPYEGDHGLQFVPRGLLPIEAYDPQNPPGDDDDD